MNSEPPHVGSYLSNGPPRFGIPVRSDSLYDSPVYEFMRLARFQIGLSALAIAVLAISLLILQQARDQRRELEQSRRQQSEQLVQLRAENERLAQRLSQAGSRPHASEDLQRLRAEAAALREQTNALAQMQDANRRLRASSPSSPHEGKSLLEAVEDARAGAIARLNYSHAWTLALIRYATEHDEQFPASFDQAATFLPDAAKAETNMTADQFELVYHGSLKTLTNPSSIIVIRERQARQNPDGSLSKAYGLADGHSEVPRVKNGDFDSFEKPRLISPPAP